jgi:capsular exopolysaccharide synthesis family protein
VDLRDCLRATRRRWWLVLATVVVALGIAGGMTALSVPQYATSVTFFVTTPSQGVTDSYQGGLFSAQRVKSYADLLVGDRLARAVAGDADIGLTSTEIQGRVTARAVPDTVLLEATVVDSDSGRSERIAKSLSKHFVSLIEDLETPLAAAKPAVKVDVVAGPLLNPTPVSPRPTRNLAVAGLVGLLLGVALAILREMLDVTIKTVETLRSLTGAPVLAVVPYDANAKQAPLVMSGNPHSARAEAVRHLRTNLQFVDVDHPVKAIVITSSVPDEGKSTTAVNLALAFAEMGRRVVLIEADLRRPRVAEYLGLEGAIGLSNVLAGQITVEEVLQTWGHGDLHILPSGFVPPNPSELLGSRNMAALLVHLRTEFDVILIDTPPLLPVTDAAVVATHADGAVLVTRSGKTAQARVRTAVASLRAVDSRVLGCVLNMQPSKGDVDYYYGTYYRDEAKRSARAGKGGTPVVAAPRSASEDDSVVESSDLAGLFTDEPATVVQPPNDKHPFNDNQPSNDKGRHSFTQYG